MDINNYISSGVLENFVLGLLSENERSEVIHMMKLHPEVAGYVRSLENSLEQYSRLHAVEPPDGLKDAVMEAIRAQKKSAENELLPPPVEHTGSTETRQGSVSLWQKLAVAAAVLLLCSVGLNIYLGSKTASNQKTVQNLNSQNQQLIADSLLKSRQLLQTQKQVAMMSNPDLHPVIMNGVQTHSGIKATVYWNSADRTVYLAQSDLPSVPEGKVYQLWAIIDGKPVDLGLYTPQQPSELPLRMKKAENGKVQAFAITLEKAGGSPSPTMDQMYVMGPVS